MRYTNDQVATAFVNRQFGLGNSTGNYKSNRNRQGEGILWSYKAPIACHALDGTIYVFNGWYSHTNTTSAQITKLKGAAEYAGVTLTILDEKPRKRDLDGLLLQLHEQRMEALFA